MARTRQRAQRSAAEVEKALAVQRNRLKAMSMDEATIDSWLQVMDREITCEFAYQMVADGLTLDRAAEAWSVLSRLPVRLVTEALRAAPYAGVTLNNLDVWARYLYMHSRADSRNWQLTWVTKARLFSSTVQADQRVAAWGAAAGLELAEMKTLAPFTDAAVEGLKAQAALLWVSMDDAPAITAPSR